ncbi:hypothetical protein D3C85_1283260 [compost metagenome]
MGIAVASGVGRVLGGVVRGGRRFHRGRGRGPGGIGGKHGRAQAGEESLEELHKGLTADRPVYRDYCGASLGESAYAAPAQVCADRAPGRAGEEAASDQCAGDIGLRRARSGAPPQYFTL